jgi:Flp pilus assembly protein TadG
VTRPNGDERGSVTVFFAVTAVALFAVFGLVLDAGRALTAKTAAASDAFAAARAGAQQLAPTGLRGGTATLDPPAAVTAAQHVLAADHLAGQITVHATTVTVTVSRQVPTDVLGLIGIRAVTVTATGAATATPGP